MTSHARPIRQVMTSRVVMLLSMLLVCMTTLGVVGGQDEEEELRTDIDKFVEGAMEASLVPGLSLAVVKNGQIFITKGYGSTRLNDLGDPVTEDTLFYIASTTKAITSTLIAQLLADTNRYTLDTPVKEIMPSFYAGDLYIQQQGSLRDMLSHRTGLSDSLYNWLLGDDINTRHEIVERGRFFKPVYPFRTKTYYNNLFYTVAGVAVEYLTNGSTWEEAMKTRLLTPLHMDSSSFWGQLTNEQLDMVARPHEIDWRNNNQPKEVDLVFFNKTSLGGPAGSMVSNARDISKWLYTLTNEGRNEEGVQVVELDVLLSTLQPTSIDQTQGGQAPFSVTGETYGLGWYTGFDRGYRRYDHGGYMYGYFSYCSFYPDLKLAIMTFSNGQQGVDPQRAIHDYITNRVMPGGMGEGANIHQSQTKKLSGPAPVRPILRQDWMTLLSDSKVLATSKNGPGLPEIHTSDNKRGRGIKVALPNGTKRRVLEEYVGVYGSFSMGNMTIIFNETTERLEGIYGPLTRADMIQNPINVDNFVGFPDEPLFFFPPIGVRFIRDEAGRVMSLTVPIFLPEDPPIFTRDLKYSDRPPPLDDNICQ